MTDIRGGTVEIVLGSENQIWVNVNGVCQFRAYAVEKIVVEDNRVDENTSLAAFPI